MVLKINFHAEMMEKIENWERRNICGKYIILDSIVIPFKKLNYFGNHILKAQFKIDGKNCLKGNVQAEIIGKIESWDRCKNLKFRLKRKKIKF